MPKLHKAQPLAQEPKPKTNIVKKWGSGLKKVLHKAKTNVPLRNRATAGEAVLEVQEQNHGGGESLQLQHTHEPHEDRPEIQPQSLDVNEDNTSTEDGDAAFDATPEPEHSIPKAEVTERTLQARSSEDESLLFVPRAVKKQSLDQKDGKTNIERNRNSTNLSNYGDSTESEGGVDVQENEFATTIEERQPVETAASNTEAFKEVSEDGSAVYGPAPGTVSEEENTHVPSTPESPASQICASGSVATPTPKVDIPKRNRHRSAPLPSEHERSSSESTLVNSPHPEPLTPSPRARGFPLPRPQAPSHIHGGDIKRPTAPFRPSREMALAGPGPFIHEDEVNSKVQDAIADTKAAMELDFALRMAQAESSIRVAADAHWEAAFNAKDDNHHNDLEEAKDEKERIVNELKEEHRSALDKLKTRHGTEIGRLRDAVQELKSEWESDGAAVQELTAEKEDLTGRLAACQDNLATALGQIRTMEAERDQQKRQGTHLAQKAVDTTSMQPGPSNRGEHRDVRFGDQGATNHVEMRLRQELAETLEQFEICQQQFQFYYAKTTELFGALEADPVRTAHVDRLLQRKEDLANELRAQSLDFSTALAREQRERQMEKEGFSDAIDLATTASRETNNHVRYLEKSRDEAWKQNEQLLEYCSTGFTVNQYDRAFADHHELVKKDNLELRYKVQGLETKGEEMHVELNRLRMHSRKNGATIPNNDDEIRQLEGQIVRLQNDNATLRIETEIARRDQEKREPEVWREARERVLRQKEDEIARLRTQLEVRDGNRDAVWVEGTSSSIGEASTSNHDIFACFERSEGLVFGDQ